jgi:hypothetical protein
MNIRNVEKKTTDIVMAATLIVGGFKLTKIDLCNQRGCFWFEDSNPTDLAKFIGEYSLGDIRVEPKAFNHKIRELTTEFKKLHGART